jgi:hypothetical protein
MHSRAQNQLHTAENKGAITCGPDNQKWSGKKLLCVMVMLLSAAQRLPQSPILSPLFLFACAGNLALTEKNTGAQCTLHHAGAEHKMPPGEVYMRLGLRGVDKQCGVRRVQVPVGPSKRMTHEHAHEILSSNAESQTEMRLRLRGMNISFTRAIRDISQHTSSPQSRAQQQQARFSMDNQNNNTTHTANPAPTISKRVPSKGYANIQTHPSDMNTAFHSAVGPGITRNKNELEPRGALEKADTDVVMVCDDEEEDQQAEQRKAEEQGEGKDGGHEEDGDEDMSYDALESRLSKVIDKIKQCEARIAGFTEITGEIRGMFCM